MALISVSHLIYANHRISAFCRVSAAHLVPTAAGPPLFFLACPVNIASSRRFSLFHSDGDYVTHAEKAQDISRSQLHRWSLMFSHTCTHSRTHMHSRTHSRTHTCTHSHTHSHTHARTQSRTNALSHARNPSRTHARTHAHTRTHTQVDVERCVMGCARLGLFVYILHSIHDPSAITDVFDSCLFLLISLEAVILQGAPRGGAVRGLWRLVLRSDSLFPQAQARQGGDTYAYALLRTLTWGTRVFELLVGNSLGMAYKRYVAHSTYGVHASNLSPMYSLSGRLLMKSFLRIWIFPRVRTWWCLGSTALKACERQTAKGNQTLPMFCASNPGFSFCLHERGDWDMGQL